MQMIAYTLQAPALPFPVFVMSYTINGIGMSIQDAQANGYVAALGESEGASFKMGIMHSVYGIGAFAAPLVATQFSQMERWSLYYLTSLGVATINTVAQSAVFRMKSQDGEVALFSSSVVLLTLLFSFLLLW
jgi:fucose permease